MPVTADWRPLFAALVALVVALLVGGHLLWALASGLILFVGGCWLWAYVVGRGLGLLMQMDVWEGSVGGSVTVRMRLDNEAVLPMTWSEIDDATPPHLAQAQSNQFGTYVTALGARVFQLPYQIKRRGIFRLGPISVRTGDPFGIFVIERSFQSPKELTVLPNIIPLADPGLPLAQPFGPIRTRQQAFEDPANVAEVRPYQPGDSPRHIHWRSSAHLGRWMIRQFELSATTELQIVLDVARDAQFGPPGADSLEEGVDLVAGLAHLAYQRGLTCSLVAQGAGLHQTPPGRGVRQLRQALYTLARVEADGEVPIDQVLLARAAALPRQGTLVVITPRLTHELGLTLLRLTSNVATSVAWIAPDAQGDVNQSGAIGPMGTAARTAAMLQGHGVQIIRLSPGDGLAPLAATNRGARNILRRGVAR